MISGRIGVDVDATLSYQPATGFELIQRLVAYPSPITVRTLHDEDLRGLLGDIATALDTPGVGLDTKALEGFRRHRRRRPRRTARFVRSGPIRTGGRGSLRRHSHCHGHLGIGIDTVATIHDVAGTITWEHHPVPRPPCTLHPLTSNERDELTAALSAWLEGNPNPTWQRILDDPWT